MLRHSWPGIKIGVSANKRDLRSNLSDYLSNAIGVLLNRTHFSSKINDMLAIIYHLLSI